MSFPFPTETVTEGSAALLVPKLSLYEKGHQYVPSLAPVFYNPRMRLNRDVAVLVLRAFQRRIGRLLRIGEPLAGSGVRGIRYAKEVQDVDNVVLNDLNPYAASLMEHNIVANDVAGRMAVSNLDANTFLTRHSAPRERFDMIDVDPYGSPSTYLETALRALNNQGLLAITATDTAPLCGVNPAAGLRKYHGKPLRTEYCRELGIRLMVNSVVWSAARQDLGIEVLLSHASDHYLRAYVQVTRGAQRSDTSIGRLGYVVHCFQCFYRACRTGLLPILVKECPRCGARLDVAGPLWLGSLVEKDFCKEAFNGAERAVEEQAPRLLGKLLEESEAPPTFYVVDKVCDKLGLQIPGKKRILEELVRCGYYARGTHFHQAGLKTDAPIDRLGDILARLSRG